MWESYYAMCWQHTKRITYGNGKLKEPIIIIIIIIIIKKFKCLA